MDLDEKKRQLDEAKSAYLAAKDKIKTLRQSIAEEICPLNVGDKVCVKDGGKEYEGIVDIIFYPPTHEELLDPVVGVEVGWAVGGARIKKTTGQLGKWTFGFNSFNAKLDGGKWIVTHKTIGEILGID